MTLDDIILSIHKSGRSIDADWEQDMAEAKEAIVRAFIDEGWLPGDKQAGREFYICDKCGNHVEEQYKPIHDSLHARASKVKI